MTQDRLQSLLQLKKESNERVNFTIFENFSVDVYPMSIHSYDDVVFFIARKDDDKYLFGVSNATTSVFDSFSSKVLFNKDIDNTLMVMQCPLSHENAVIMRRLFDHTRPRLIGVENSFGLGDRIGLANPGHLRAIRDTGFRPVLAQQSIRELTRTERTPEEVMDAATWAVFQEGYRDGFGSDADHLKTTDDIDLMVQAGFTMFTIDPSEYVVNEASKLPDTELSQRAERVAWDDLDDNLESMAGRYTGTAITPEDSFRMEPSMKEVVQAIVKYGNVVAHVVRMHRHLKTSYPDYPSEIEVSVDETDSPTSLFEHFFIANELKRLGVGLVSLAPRFIGDFEKGIDYRGEIDAFTDEYQKHVAIAGVLGPYKISIHSGSDKFTVYRAIGSIGKGHVHVKTAGTSYLEALRVVSVKEPGLFRSILTFSLGNFTREKQTYHVCGSLEGVPDPDSLEDHELVNLFENDDARQVLHVAFGKVLTLKDTSGAFVFKDKVLHCLNENEELHYRFVEKHFRRHIEPFGSTGK
jgi:tagaturonate epimerase